MVTRGVYESMVERGGGAIVNQSSAAAWMGAGYYGIAKLALHAITHSLARELGPRKIRVNAIAPGPTDTEATRKIVPDGIRDMILSSMPLSRMGTVEDMVKACLFLPKPSLFGKVNTSVKTRSGITSRKGSKSFSSASLGST